jgi:hypothetical protein
MKDETMIREPMGTVDVRRSVRLDMPATLAELERFCAKLRAEKVNAETAVRAGAGVGVNHPYLYVNIKES